MAKYNVNVTGEGGTVSIEAVLNKLGGIAGALRFLRGEFALVEVGNALRTMQVEIGRHKSARAMGKVLTSLGDKRNSWSAYLLGKTSFADRKKTLTLVVASGRDLCGARNTTTAKIFATGLARGWQLCPAEVGPALREQYRNQQKGESLRIAMDPILDQDGALFVFRVVRDDGDLWLVAIGGHPDRECDPESLWVFTLPSKP